MHYFHISGNNFYVSALFFGTNYLIQCEMLQEDLIEPFCDFVADAFILKYINMFF